MSTAWQQTKSDLSSHCLGRASDANLPTGGSWGVGKSLKGSLNAGPHLLQLPDLGLGKVPYKVCTRGMESENNFDTIGEGDIEKSWR